MPHAIGGPSIIEEPEFLGGQFQTFLDRPDFTSNQRRFFQNRFQTTLDRFRQALVQNQLSPPSEFGPEPLEFITTASDQRDRFRDPNTGQIVIDPEIPELTFGDFLQPQNFLRRFANMAPSIAGRQTGRFTPRTRFLNF